MTFMTLLDAIRLAPRVYIIGNGGSYANAVHICNDLLASGIRAYTLDPATLTASANDFGYETVFSRWLSVVGEPGDVLLALSGSGKSPNILAGVAKARELDMDVWTLYGAVMKQDMQEAEEHQISIGHDLMRALKAARESC